MLPRKCRAKFIKDQIKDDVGTKIIVAKRNDNWKETHLGW
jgi:hypothetical protein